MIREKIASYAHQAWSGWMKYMFSKSQIYSDGSVTIPASLVTRWKRQIDTPYPDLPVQEKLSDLEEADKILSLFLAEVEDCRVSESKPYGDVTTFNIAWEKGHNYALDELKRRLG